MTEHNNEEVEKVTTKISLAESEYWKTFKSRYIKNDCYSVQENQLGPNNNEQNK